jgi:hypothetical protein
MRELEYLAIISSCKAPEDGQKKVGLDFVGSDAGDNSKSNKKSAYSCNIRLANIVDHLGLVSRNPRRDHLCAVLDKLELKPGANPDELSGRIRSMAIAGGEHAGIYQTRAMTLDENDDGCLRTMLDLIKSILGLMIAERFDGYDCSSTQTIQLLRTKVVPKL